MRNTKLLAGAALSYFLPRMEQPFLYRPHCHADTSNGSYFIDFRHKTEYGGPFDASGIPMLDLSCVPTARSTEIVYSPIMIAQSGLGWHATYLAGGTPMARERFLDVASWLLEHARLGRSGRRAATLDVSFGRGRWCLSGMAQGLAISVLCRAWRMTGEQGYLEKALEAFEPMTLPIADGGVVDASLGFPVLEEFTDEPIHIMNGHLFGYAGVLDLAAALDTRGSGAAADRVARYCSIYETASLELAGRCDLGFWTRYSLRPGLLPNIASWFYQQLHIEMMIGLHEMTDIDAFRVYGERWRRYACRHWARVLALLLKILDFTYVYVQTGRRFRARSA